VIDVLYIAWRYLRYNWGKTIVLIASISLIVFLPAGLQLVVHEGARMLTERAESTPLLIGPKGSAIDLVLSALYFKEPSLDPMEFGEVTRIAEAGLAVPVPLHMRYSVGAHRIVGTTPEYFEFRAFDFARGRAMAILGECVLGSAAARALGADVDGHVLSSPAGAFDVAGSYPLKMRVVGVLNPTNTADDDAVFVDLKTSWAIAGLAHGHQDVAAPDAADNVLKHEGENLVASPAVLSYTEITLDNIDSFHFHGDPGTFPVDAILAVPKDRKSGVMLRGRFEEGSETLQILVPLDVINELLDTLFSVRDYIVLIGIALGIATIAICVLVFVLSIRIRKREIETIRKIGAPRKRLYAILATEIVLVVALSILVAGGLTAGVGQFGETLIHLIAR
jgi:putative ABC transport system permease protein